MPIRNRKTIKDDFNNNKIRKINKPYQVQMSRLDNSVLNTSSTR